MKKQISLLLAFFLTLFYIPNAFSEDLMTAYNQALASDPAFKAAEATWRATQELSSISRAALLPSISGSAGLSRGYIKQAIGTDIHNSFYQNTKTYGLNLNQVLFDYRAWSALRNASAQVKGGFATYNAAQQNLMIRVATAYLAVLQAHDELVATQAQKRSLSQQLDQTQAQFKSGLIPITGVDQVRANYDAVVSQEIANQNNISDKLEELRAITGSFYRQIGGLSTQAPLLSPVPAQIDLWVKTAAKQNYTLQAAHYATVAAHENVNIQRAGHFPIIAATGSFQDQHNGNSFTSVPPANSNLLADNRVAQLGLNVNLPIFQGGMVVAQTRQAADQYAQFSAQEESTYRATLTQTRESYLGVVAGVSKLKADKQMVASNDASVAAIKGGYQVGNNTILDVLQQQSSLYSAQTTYALDQYNYLLSILNLKLAAGTLSPADLAQINSWLTRKIDLSAYDFNMPVQVKDKNA